MPRWSPRWAARSRDKARFVPPALDEANAQRYIDDLVSDLSPAALDDATGPILDPLVGWLVRQWAYDLRVRYWTHLSHSPVPALLETAMGDVDRLDAEYKHSLRLLEQQHIALEAALLRLACHDGTDR